MMIHHIFVKLLSALEVYRMPFSPIIQGQIISTAPVGFMGLINFAFSFLFFLFINPVIWIQVKYVRFFFVVFVFRTDCSWSSHYLVNLWRIIERGEFSFILLCNNAVNAYPRLTFILISNMVNVTTMPPPSLVTTLCCPGQTRPSVVRCLLIC